jgi:phenylpropionate dioxygenase-like ring-hydroxylating dioxygenase large terminal subunit
MPWTAIALSRDIPPENTRAVRVDGREIVIWRGSDGEAHVWEDRCPHRGMRLSFGFVRGTVLNCLYHGWRYAASASCAGIPAHPDLTVPPTIKANAFAVREAGGMVWTRFDEGTDEPPALPASAVPVASVAIGAGTTVPPTVAVEGGTLHLQAHSPAVNRTTVHAVADTEAARAAGWAWLRTFRHAVEQGAVA